MKRKKKNLITKDENYLESYFENHLQKKSKESEEFVKEKEESIILSRKIGELIRKEAEESVLKIMSQVFNPYLVAGFGMVLAGNVLNVVKDWDVFTSIPQLITMVPALLGLKGNLEMTLAARLSTQANLGTLERRREAIEVVLGNLILSQFQSLVVGCLSAVVAVAFGVMENGGVMVSKDTFVVMVVSAMVTASLASLLLGVLMTIVIFISRHFHINPDNVATPIAGSLGDLVSILLLAVIASSISHLTVHSPWLVWLLLFFLFGSMPIYVYVSAHNKYVRGVLYGGWVPIIVAMVISSVGGFFLDGTISHYRGLALLQPLVNGIGGNLVAIQASRQSTLLHRLGPPGSSGRVHFNLRGCTACTATFSCQQLGRRSKRALQLLVIPGHVIFLFFVWLLNHGNNVTTITNFTFVLIYLVAVVVQVFILLAISDYLVPALWRANQDPDTCAIPYLTALGDVLGVFLLAVTFKLHRGLKMVKF